MNWNGGALARSRKPKKKKPSVSAAQKRYFLKAQAQSEMPRPFRADLEFSTLEHAMKEELAARKWSPPSHRVDHHAGSSKGSEASLKEGRAVTHPSSSSSPASLISCDYIKGDSFEDQKLKLLAMNDWCGLKKPRLVGMISTGTENVYVNGDGRKGNKRVNKRRLSESSEACSPLESLAGITDKEKLPDARNLHNAQEKRYRANKRHQSESGMRIGPLDERSGDDSKSGSCSLHTDSPFCNTLERVTTPYASHYSNSDENLFADEYTKSQQLFQPSPLRRIAYDWSDIKSDIILSAGCPLDTRSLTVSPAGIKLKTANHHRHPWVSGLPQARSSISSRLSAELTEGDVPVTSKNYMSQGSKSGLVIKGPKLNSENLSRFLLQHENAEPIYRYSNVNAQSHSAKSVEIAATDSIEHDPRAQEEFCTPSPLLAMSDLYVPVTASNVREGGIATGEPGPATCPSSSKEGTVGNLTCSTVLTRKIVVEESLSPDSGWKDFVIGDTNEETGDISSSTQNCVNSQVDSQSPDSCRDKEEFSLLSSPHQFNFLYSEPSDEPSLDQQNPHGYQGILSSPHRFSSISSDQSAITQSTACATCSLPDISREIPFCSPEHPPTLQDRLASSYDRESTEELEQPAECFVKPAFIFTKPTRFVGERVVEVSSSTETGEYKRSSTDSSLGQVHPEWRLEEEEVEDIED